MQPSSLLMRVKDCPTARAALPRLGESELLTGARNPVSKVSNPYRLSCANQGTQPTFWLKQPIDMNISTGSSATDTATSILLAKTTQAAMNRKDMMVRLHRCTA